MIMHSNFIGRWKVSCLVVGILLFSFTAWTQVTPNASILYQAGPPNYGERLFKIPSFGWGPELTPRVFMMNGERMYVYSGNPSMICNPAGNDHLINGNVLPAYNHSQQVIKPAHIWALTSSGTVIPNGEWDGQRDDNGHDIWNFTYDGILDQFVSGNSLYVIRHNEHQNVKEGPSALGFQGNIITGRHLSPIYAAGYWTVHTNGTASAGGPWRNDWSSPWIPNGTPQGGSYGSFASLAKLDFDTWGNVTNIVDYGPIAWPVTGFVTSQSQRTEVHPQRPGTGHQHPSLILAEDGNMYAFLQDREGISVARAPLSQPSAMNWKMWGAGSWTTAMPADMTTTDMENYYHVPGPAADMVILDSGWTTLWFQVAKIMNGSTFTGTYLGVEYRRNSNNTVSQMGIRYSNGTDLTQWSNFHELATGTGFGQGYYTYPTFYNLECTSNNEIELNDFFIFGLDKRVTDGKTFLMRLKLDNVPGVTSIPSPDYVTFENNSTTVLAFPNPSNNTMKVHIPSTTQQPIRYVLTDITGKQVYQKVISQPELGINVVEFSKAELGQGVYFLQLIQKGTPTQRLRLLFQ